MVRKWSYLNTVPFKLDDDFIRACVGRRRFKVFRTTTRFKKFNIGMSRVVRKLYVRQRRRTNLIVLSYITADWINFFTRARQFYRFFQSCGLFALSVYSADTPVAVKKISNMDGSKGLGVNSFACADRILFGFLKERYFIGSNRHFLLSPLGFSANSSIATTSRHSYEVLAELGPGVAVYDNINYPYDCITDNIDLQKELSGINNTLFSSTLARIVDLRQIIILISLLNSLGTKKI